MRPPVDTMTQPTKEEAQQALDILAGQCGHAKIRKETKDILKKRLNIVTPETYEALNGGPPLKRQGPEPSALHLDNLNPGPQDILILEARCRALEVHGVEAMRPPDVRHGFSVEHIIFRLNEKIKILNTMNQRSTTHPPAQAPEQPEGGVGET